MKMCPTPKPVSEFGKCVIEHLVDQRFDLVKEELDLFEKKGYYIYYKKISWNEYISDFIETSRTMMKQAKKLSKGLRYNGMLVFCPSINKKNYDDLFGNRARSSFSNAYWNLLDWSMHFNNNQCLNGMIGNSSEKSCKDNSIYLMVFYFKGGLNRK